LKHPDPWVLDKGQWSLSAFQALLPLKSRGGFSKNISLISLLHLVCSAMRAVN
jgi:hypothetical protein